MGEAIHTMPNRRDAKFRYLGVKRCFAVWRNS